MSVNGYCDHKFIELREYFEESVNSKFELGAAISIEIEGESAVSYTHLTLPTTRYV